MSRFCFVHAADLRLDTPFEGIGRVTAEVADVLRDASLDAWDALVELSIDRQAAFLLLAGNIYDGTDCGMRAQLRFLRGLERLDEHGIQTFIAFGDHDAPNEWSAVRQWPESVVFFGTDDVGRYAVEREGERLATVYGLSYRGPDAGENAAHAFRRGDEPGLHAGILHTSVAADTGEVTCSLDDLLNVNMDYWALGHNRRRQILNESPSWVAYSGTLQGRSPDPIDQGPKGALVVEAEGDSVMQVAFEPLDRVRFVGSELDVSALDDMAALRNALTQKLGELKAENQGRSLLVRTILKGRGGMHAVLKRPDVLAELVRDLREEAEDETALVWWENVLDRSQPELNRDVIRRRNDFSAELLRQGDLLRKDAAALSDFTEDQCKLLSRLTVRKTLRNLESAEAEDILREAEDLALDLLEGAEDP